MTLAPLRLRVARARRPAPPLHGLVLLAWAVLALHAAARAAEPALPAVVVWDFDNQTAPGLAAVPRERTDWLRRALSEHFTGALLAVPGLPVVERLKLGALLAEQKIASSALADEAGRVRLGQVIGAQRMVFGGFFVVGDAVQVHLRLVDTASGRVLLTDEALAPFDAVMGQLAPLTQRLARALGAAAPAAARPGAAPAGAPDWPAELWQAHDRALALADDGRLPEALDALKALLERRPDFTPAQRQVGAVLERLARR